MSTDQELIDDVLDNFNFENVHVAMTVLKWTWSLENGLEVPSKAQLRRMARSLLKDVITKSYEKVGSGGFEASFDKESRHLALSFVLEQYTTEVSDTLHV
ncbi:hypothetical protein EBR43_03855 [bacterium]|nr:hypothetical protein [bacterium]